MSLLPKTRRILERPVMEFRPFGRDLQGRTIQDVSGITVSANLEYLEASIAKEQDTNAAQAALNTLVELLNQRIPDPTYHVTLEFLKNPWNSYSYEFVMFLAEFSIQLSGQPDYHFNMGRQKFLSPIVKILGRPFSIVQIYRLFPYFVEKFTKGSLQPEVVSVTNGHAVMRLKFSESTSAQFGPYLRGCAERVCHTTKATIAQVPASMFGLSAATIQDTSCMADGAPFCEWTFTWHPQSATYSNWVLIGVLCGVVTFILMTASIPQYPWWSRTGVALLPILIFALAGRLWRDRNELKEKSAIIQEQLASAEDQHEELRKVYLQQEHSLTQVRRHVDELTMLHDLSLQIGSTVQQHIILDVGLEALVRSLPFDHAWIALWNEPSQQFENIRSIGMAYFTNSNLQGLTVPAMPDDLFSQALNSHAPLVIESAEHLHDHVHPTTCRLLQDRNFQTGMALSLFSNNQPLGVIVGGSQQTRLLSDPEQNLLSTIVHQLAIALDTALAYDKIEALNISLEAKVKARTTELQETNAELEAANTRLKELDRMKSQFLSHCSHELRTPLTSIKGFAENMLRGMVGPLEERQHLYLTRINANADRLTRMIADLLDLSRIEAGTIRLHHQSVALLDLVEQVGQEFMPLLQPKKQQLIIDTPDQPLFVWADPDRIHQIVTNLVHNAHKFTPENGQITITASQGSNHEISLAVSDTGPGIPQDALANLFQPFVQAHRKPEIGTQGLGLGLSIVKQLVELHGASITVESTIGAGTAFRLQFPNPP